MSFPIIPATNPTSFVNISHHLYQSFFLNMIPHRVSGHAVAAIRYPGAVAFGTWRRWIKPFVFSAALAKFTLHPFTHTQLNAPFAHLPFWAFSSFFISRHGRIWLNSATVVIERPPEELRKAHIRKYFILSPFITFDDKWRRLKPHLHSRLIKASEAVPQRFFHVVVTLGQPSRCSRIFRWAFDRPSSVRLYISKLHR